jgi:intracellular septation protein A
MSDSLTVGPEPTGRIPFREMLPALVFDVAVPIVVFNILARYGVATLWALAAGGLSPVVNNIRIWVRARRVEPLGIIVIGFLAIGTAVSLITHSVFIGLVKASFLTASFGLICFGSLFAKRPLMFYVTRQFVAGDDRVRLAWWNGLWQFRSFRDAQRVVTTVWGVAYLVEALLRVGFALTLSPAQVVVVSPMIGVGAMVALITWTRRYLLAVRERRLSELRQSPPVEPAA